MAEKNPQPVEVTDHDEGQEPQERQWVIVVPDSFVKLLPMLVLRIK